MSIIVECASPFFLSQQSISIVVSEIDGGVIIRNLDFTRSIVIRGRLPTLFIGIGIVVPREPRLPVPVIVTESLNHAGATDIGLAVPGMVVGSEIGRAHV